MRKKVVLFSLMMSVITTAFSSCSGKEKEVFADPVNIMEESVLTEDDFLKADGRDLKNRSGEGDLINLRGVNFGGLFIQELWMCPTFTSKNVSDQTDIINVLTERFGEEGRDELIATWEDNYVTEDDFAYLSKIGANVVRVPFFYRDVMDTEGNFIDYHENAPDPYADTFRRFDDLIR